MEKPIKRLDAKESDITMEQKREKWTKQQHEVVDMLSSEKLEIEVLEKIYESDKEKKISKNVEKLFKEWDERDKKRFIENPTGKFKYEDKVRVIKSGDCSHAGGHLNETGIIMSQNSCKCVHPEDKTCYYIKFNDASGLHHFGESSLEKA